MNPSYEIFLRTEAVEALRAIRGANRRQVAAFIDSLSANPSTEGDYQMRDSANRDIQIKVLGEFAVTFWTDHAVREIKIIDIRCADTA